MELFKVLVFTPIYNGKDYCLDEFIEKCKTFTYKNYEHIFVDNSDDNGVYYNKLKEKLEPLGIKVYHVDRGATTRESLARAQNLARKIFLEGDYDYFMSLESDIFPGSNIIEALLWDNRDIVSGLYLLGIKGVHRRIPCVTILYDKQDGGIGSRLIREDEVPDYYMQGLKKVFGGGFGCCMIYRPVLEKIGFTYVPGHSAHSDTFFFMNAHQRGFQVWVDTNLLCAHKASDWRKVENM